MKLCIEFGIMLSNKQVITSETFSIIQLSTNKFVKVMINFSFIILLIFSTESEAQSNQKVLHYCVDPHWMPFEGAVNSEHTGIASDYLKIFSELTPYTFKIKNTPTWKKSTELLKSGECDLTLMLNSSLEREKYLAFTMPYFFGPNVLVSKQEVPFMQGLNSLGNMTLGVVSGYRLLEEIPLYYPDIKLKVVSDESEGLIAVEQGIIDVYVGSLYSINLTINQLNLHSLKINGWIALQDKLRIGFTKSNADLIPIFNQAIDKISTKQHNEILNKWTNTQIVKQIDYTLLYYIASGTVFIMLLFLWRYLVSVKIYNALKNKNQELENIKQELMVSNKNLRYLSFHDNLTKLYNRHYFMSTLEDHFNNIVRERGIAAILMIDLDFFKKINDQYGHTVGDKVLQQFSTILSKVLRAGDVAARWGGEEFIVLLPKANQEETLALAKRLSKTVEQFSFELNINLTISVGISQYNAHDNMESWIERADIALYKAKNEGRNCIKEMA